MRQFILAKNVAYPTSNDLTALADGAVGIFYNADGVPTVTDDGSEITKEAMLILGRPQDKGGNVVLPIFKNNFSYTKGTYSAATKFTATITIPDATSTGDYSIIVVKKGMKFNERSNWTANVLNTDVETTAATMAQKLADAINSMSASSGVSASVSTATITITAQTSGVDYQIVPADNLTGVTVTVTTHGLPAYGDANYIKDLADKAAADAGYEYTYMESAHYLYPNYPLNPLAAANTTDTGYTIFTIKFAEPRIVKTVDTVINQIIQVAFPTGTEAITTFEAVLKGLVG